MEEGAREGDDEATEGGGSAQDRVEDGKGEGAVLWVGEAAHAQGKDGKPEGGTEWQRRDRAQRHVVWIGREGGAQPRDKGRQRPH